MQAIRRYHDGVEDCLPIDHRLHAEKRLPNGRLPSVMLSDCHVKVLSQRDLEGKECCKRRHSRFNCRLKHFEIMIEDRC